MSVFWFGFFFQAEDGIRDVAVTGVQTCALPISYGPSVQNRELPYSPPTRMHFVDASGFHLRPFVYASTLTLDSYEEDRTHEYPVHLFVRGDNYTILAWIIHQGSSQKRKDALKG